MPPQDKSAMRRLLCISALLLLTTVAILCGVGWWQDVPRSDPDQPPVARNSDRRLDQVALSAAPKAAPAMPLQIQKFCGTCHVLPMPDCEIKANWPLCIKQMYETVQRDLPWPESQLPPIEHITEFYVTHAPPHFLLDPSATGSPPSPLSFIEHPLKPQEFTGPPAVSSVRFVRLSDAGPLQLLVCDMRHGAVVLWSPSEPDSPARVLASIPHPAHTTIVDLDQDGILDILVANLGVFWDDDTQAGSVVWLQGKGGDRFEPVELFTGLGRVSDVQAADFDSDGDLDLMVAVFGHYHTGCILYLENYTTDYAEPDFATFVVESHSGAIVVPIVDLNADGSPDFVTLIAQEREQVVAFLNTGRGRFVKQVIHTAPHPKWGSIGIELTDMDQDGDLDVLWSHGDAVELPLIPRPYHGISWLENKGVFPFEYHRLAYLPGAHTAHRADLDGDGDLDIVSTTFLPTIGWDVSLAKTLESIIWFEKTDADAYRRYALELSRACHPTMDVGDYDGDGDVDIAVGNFFMKSTGSEVPNSRGHVGDAWVSLWENPTADGRTRTEK
jgi:hypothetical protein